MTTIEDEEMAKNYFTVVMKPIIWKICWNRDYSALNLFRPQRLNNYYLRYVHGHDHEFTNNSHYISLDGYLGKSLEDNIGELKELKSLDVSLKDYEQQEKENSSWSGLFKYILLNTDCKKYYPWIGLLVAGIIIKKYNPQIPQCYLKNMFFFAKKVLGFSTEQHIVYNRP